MMKKERLVTLALLLTMLAICLTGCSSRNQKEAALYVSVINTYVDEEKAVELQSQLNKSLPALSTEDSTLSVTAISSGDTERDPMGAMAGMTQIAGLMASGEMELILASEENARRYGENGTAYIPLAELFSAEEQAALGIVPAVVKTSDDEGNLTGDVSAPCGVNLSGCKAFADLIGFSDVGAYVMKGSKHVDAAKQVITYLLSMQ